MTPWFSRCERELLLKEIWQGKRWKELHYIWDPDRDFYLPDQCDNCAHILSASLIRKCFAEEKMVICEHCGHLQAKAPKKSKGNPFNLGLIGHWDGWQPFGTVTRGSGAIEVHLANLPKEIRSSVDEVYVIGFVPVCLLPHQNLDPFFKPFLEEIKDIFINGLTIPVSNPRVIGNITLPETMVIREVLVLMTGDHPTQCETGKFLNQG